MIKVTDEYTNRVAAIRVTINSDLQSYQQIGMVNERDSDLYLVYWNEDDCKSGAKFVEDENFEFEVLACTSGTVAPPEGGFIA